MQFSTEFLQAIPKTDLHLHLDGSLRLSSLIEMAKKSKVELPSYTEEGLRELVFKDRYANLGEYLHGFMYTCAVLRDLENLERTAYELAVDNQVEGVRYIEVRFAPQLQMDNKEMTMEKIFGALHKGFDRAKKEFNCRKEVVEGDEPPFDYGIIACAMRMFGKNFSPYYEHFWNLHQYSTSTEIMQNAALELAKGIVKIRDQAGIPIVGFDLAGAEAGFPASNFKEAYAYVHKNFMHKTVHAGEAYGAESIFQAITDLYADRIGHGYYLFDEDKVTDPSIENKSAYINGLSSFIADRRTTIEICLTSNLQTNPALTNLSDHSFKEMLKRKISTTICTDNRLVSNTTVTRELELATQNFEMSEIELKNMIIYGFKRSFFFGSYSEKRLFVRKMINYYDKIVSQFS